MVQEAGCQWHVTWPTHLQLGRQVASAGPKDLGNHRLQVLLVQGWLDGLPVQAASAVTCPGMACVLEVWVQSSQEQAAAARVQLALLAFALASHCPL